MTIRQKRHVSLKCGSGREWDFVLYKKTNVLSGEEKLPVPLSGGWPAAFRHRRLFRFDDRETAKIIWQEVSHEDLSATDVTTPEIVDLLNRALTELRGKRAK